MLRIAIMESRIAIIYSLRYLRSAGRLLYGNTSLLDDTSMAVSCTRSERSVPIAQEITRLNAKRVPETHGQTRSSRDEDIA